MSKRITRLALVLGAAAALAAPAAPASADPTSCSVTIKECIDRILESIAASPAIECVYVTTFVEVCPPAAG